MTHCWMDLRVLQGIVSLDPRLYSQDPRYSRPIILDSGVPENSLDEAVFRRVHSRRRFQHSYIGFVRTLANFQKLHFRDGLVQGYRQVYRI